MFWVYVSYQALSWVTETIVSKTSTVPALRDLGIWWGETDVTRARLTANINQNKVCVVPHQPYAVGTIIISCFYRWINWKNEWPSKLSTVTQLMNDETGDVNPDSVFLESFFFPCPSRSSPPGIYFASLFYLSLSARATFCDSICVWLVRERSKIGVSASSGFVMLQEEMTSKSEWLTVTNISWSHYISKSFLTSSSFRSACQKQPTVTKACSTSKAQAHLPCFVYQPIAGNSFAKYFIAA